MEAASITSVDASRTESSCRRNRKRQTKCNEQSLRHHFLHFVKGYFVVIGMVDKRRKQQRSWRRKIL